MRLSVAASAWETMRQGGAGTAKGNGNRNEPAALRAVADELLDGGRPFHWPLEFPEVFIEEARGETPRGQHGLDGFGETLTPLLAQNDPSVLLTNGLGFAALMSNPPFQGGQKITGTLGVPYRDYLVEYLARGRRGSADLCAYFFLRAGGLAQQGGQAGLIATNTIAQGDTREVALDQLMQDGFTIPRAVPSRPWPGVAALEVAHIWLRRGNWANTYVLDDEVVSGISSLLTVPNTVEGRPVELIANSDKSFQGPIVLGMGFVLTPDEANALITANPRYSDVLFPYLNGEDLNSRADQSASRWVINFHDWPLEKAATYSDCITIVREKVKPERDKNPRAARRERWWQFAERQPALTAAIKGLDRVLITARVSAHHFFAFANVNQVFSDRLVVLALSKYADFALLSSWLHDSWAHRPGTTTHETRNTYFPSDCFETFPFPAPLDSLDAIGEAYYEHRREVMLAHQEGLTKTYNRFHDPGETSADIAELRRIHVAMDQAVAAAYGWADLSLGHGFHQTRQGLRYTISEAARRTVLDRLLALNHARYAKEVAQGLHDKGAKKSKERAKKSIARPAPSTDAPQLPLDFDGPQPIKPAVETTIIDFQQTTEELARKRATEERETYDPAEITPAISAVDPSRVATMTPIDRHIILLARVIQQHRERGYDKTLGRVKVEKIAHLVEAHYGVELGRTPVRAAAGPLDFGHLKAVFHRAKAIGAFYERQRSGHRKGYEFVPLSGLKRTAARMGEAFGPLAAQIDTLTDHFTGLTSDQAEIVATLYAAWNDLLAAGEDVNEERLIKAFYDWSESKHQFQPGEVRAMKAWMEAEGLVPTGKAKQTAPHRNE